MSSNPTTLLSISWDQQTLTFSLFVSVWIVGLAIALAAILILMRLRNGGLLSRNFEIDQAEIGVGTSRFRFKPNITDRQVAYAIWVELSTRKIGLPIDLNHDVIVEIYDSWYNFFSVTRELIKSVSVTQVKRASTQAIIKLSIEVLNEGLRPHLTQWQARFRHWYDRELKRYDEQTDQDVLDPQRIQAKFPQFDELQSDMQRVNAALIKYRAKMRELVLNE
jgi:hypothetical protein